MPNAITTTTTAPVKQPTRIPLAQPSETPLEPVVPPPIEEVLAAQAAQQNIDAARVPSPLTAILNPPASVPQLAPQYGLFAGPAPKPGELYNPADTFGEKVGRVIAALGPIGDALVMAGGSPEQRRMLLERQERDYARARQSQLDARQLRLDQAAQQERARQAALEQQAAERADAQLRSELFRRSMEGGPVTYQGQTVVQPGAKAMAQLEQETIRAREDAQADARIRQDLNRITAELIGAGYKPGTPEFQNQFAVKIGITGKEPMVDAGEFLGDPRLRGVKMPVSKVLNARMQQQRINISLNNQDRFSNDQTKAIQEMMATLDDMLSVRDIFQQAKKLIGPALGRARDWFYTLGFDVDDRFAMLDSEVNTLRNTLLKTRSGAAVTDQELRRIARELPYVTDSASNFAIKLDRAIRRMNAVIDVHMKTGGKPTLQEMQRVLEAIESRKGASAQRGAAGTSQIQRRRYNPQTGRIE